MIAAAHIFATVSGLVVKSTKSTDIFESARLVMSTSVWVVGSSPVRNQSSSYCIGQGDWMSAEEVCYFARLTVRLTDDSTTCSFIDRVAEP